MEVQSSVNNINVPFFLDSQGAYNQSGQTIFGDGARVGDLKFGTVMAQNAVTKKWFPHTDPAAIDGTARPRGIYIGEDIPEATLKAGDVEDSRILLGGTALVNESLVIFEVGDKDTTFAPGNVQMSRLEDLLAEIGIFFGQFENNSELENA